MRRLLVNVTLRVASLFVYAWLLTVFFNALNSAYAVAPAPGYWAAFWGLLIVMSLSDFISFNRSHPEW